MNTAPLLPYLEPAVIDRGHELFHRNAAEITDIQRTFNMTEVSGNCLGSQGDLYHPRMAMHISPDGVLRAFFGHCSCPYGVNCKHTAALYLTLYGRRTISLPDAGHASSNPHRNADVFRELFDTD